MCLDGCGSDVEVQTRVLSCLASWLNMKNFPVDEVAQSTLISLPFQVLVCGGWLEEGSCEDV